jgi:hypothetical protein
MSLQLGLDSMGAFSAGTVDAYVPAKPVSFSISYWYARNYAGNLGGETVTALRVVLSKLKAMASNSENRALHERALRQVMERSPLTYGETLRELIERLQGGFLEQRLPEITHLIEKYAPRIGNFPVILAIRLQERQVDPKSRSFLGSFLALDCSTRIRFGGAEVRTLPEVIVRHHAIRVRRYLGTTQIANASRRGTLMHGIVSLSIDQRRPLFSSELR